MAEISFRLNKNILSPLISKGLSVVPQSSAVPILQCFKLDVAPTGLSVSSTNLENSIKSTTDQIQTVDTFSFVIPAKKFNSIVSKADVGEIDFSISSGVISVESGNASWQLQIPSGKAFPTLPEIPDLIDIEVERFKSAFLSVRKFVSSDVTRPSLRMTHVEKSKMTACDGIRFSQALIGEDFPDSLIFDIPALSGDHLVSLLKDAPSLKLGLTDSHLIFQSGQTSLFMNKLTASYPSVEQIMLRPALENKTILRFDKSELIKAINRVRINVDVLTEAIGLAISASSITVTSKDKNGNGASDTIPASWPSKDRLLIVNYTYLLQLLNSSSRDDCELLLGEDTKSRKSVLLLKEDNYIGLFPQTSGNLRVF